LTNGAGYTCTFRILICLLFDGVSPISLQSSHFGILGCSIKFVIVSRPHCCETVARGIISDFDESILNHYNKDDRERGYLEGIDRQGLVRRIPLASISAAIVTNEHRELFHPLQIAEIAAEVKRNLKTLPGSKCGFDRRRI
jgi:hypothetical protein